MHMLILGSGPMARALADALVAAGDRVTVRGRPPDGRHPVELFAGAEVVFDFSTGSAVAANTEQALAAGARRLVIGTTGWDGDRATVERLVVGSAASAVAAANFSLGIALFERLVETATRLFAPLTDYDPFIVEWHRARKADRPSGTAREIARRLVAAHPRKRLARPADQTGPIDGDELEVASVRAGASPGMHLVGFDAPGETIELRVTARDRTAYAAGAIAAAEWLLRAPRAPGLHPIEAVVAELTAAHSGSDPAATSSQGGLP